jgi:hypothetical protein
MRSASASLFAYDLRLRYGSIANIQQSTFLLDVGRTFGYHRSGVRVLLQSSIAGKLAAAASNGDDAYDLLCECVFDDRIDRYVQSRIKPTAHDSAPFSHPE